jgi:Protein of unknown function (DUF1573)
MRHKFQDQASRTLSGMRSGYFITRQPYSHMLRHIFIHLLSFLVPLAGVNGAALAFENKTVKVTAKPGTEQVTLVFPFENKSGETIEIERQASPCGCIKAEIKEGKMTYAHGDKGEVTAIFKVGNLQGTVSKNVVIWQKGDKATDPSVILTAVIEIPERVAITPKTLNWKAGEENVGKTCSIKVNEGETIHVTGVTTTNNHFAPQLKTIADGREYEITINPKDTREAGFAILKITTDSQDPRFCRLQGFATITR